MKQEIERATDAVEASQPEQQPVTSDPRAPMASAPLVYNAEGDVAWDQMWEAFCVLASQGGPPHRDTMLHAPLAADPTTPGYQQAAEEIIRGIRLVSGLAAAPATPGWIAIECESPGKAQWLREQIRLENVEAQCKDTELWVPVAEDYTVKGEVKNVITAVAKTTHYWNDHLAAEIKMTLVWEEKLAALGKRVRQWIRTVQNLGSTTR